MNRLHPTFTRILSLLMSAVALSGCAPGSGALYDTLKGVSPLSKSSGEPVGLVSGLDYLRVNNGGVVTYLALWGVEPGPDGQREVWISGSRELVKTVDGRVVSTAGLPVDWRETRFDGIPSWRSLSGAVAAASFVRERDVMPGYRYGIRERLQLTRAVPTQESRLENLAPEGAEWFEERVLGLDSGLPVMPSNWYAVVKGADGAGQVVAGTHCMSPEYCWVWRRLSVPVAQGKAP
jgi:hypothetical protein